MGAAVSSVPLFYAMSDSLSVCVCVYVCNLCNFYETPAAFFFFFCSRDTQVVSFLSSSSVFVRALFEFSSLRNEDSVGGGWVVRSAEDGCRG